MNQQPSLSLVASVAELRASLASFNSERTRAHGTRTLLRTTSYWVYDSAMKQFGPAKFVGFSEMTHATYDRAKQHGSSADPFDGHATRTQIERVVGTEFKPNRVLAARLRTWANGLVGDEAFAGIDASKWMFLELGKRTQRLGVTRVHDEGGRPLDAHFAVERVDQHLTVVIESRGGVIGTTTARNTDYARGLALLLARLKALGAIVDDVLVDSAQARNLAPSARRLVGPRLNYPFTIDDPIELQRLLGAAQAKVRGTPNAKGGGNPTKRIRVYLHLGQAALSPHVLKVVLSGRSGGAPFDSARTPSDGALGENYEDADETRTTSKRQPFDVDPDLVDRGNRGHAATQNALARHLRALGLIPRSAKRGGPEFDLAWEHGGLLYVAEVKSITDENEEKQLRLGLGQLLRYRQRMSATGRQVVAVLVTERKPTDPGWLALCTELSVVIAWPEALDRIEAHHGGTSSIHVAQPTYLRFFSGT